MQPFLSFGSSISSWVCPLTSILLGSKTLHSSQFKVLHIYDVQFGRSFLLNLLANHSYKQFKCMNSIVPVQLHGEIIGFSSSKLSQKHMRQILFAIISPFVFSVPSAELTTWGFGSLIRFPPLAPPLSMALDLRFVAEVSNSRPETSRTLKVTRPTLKMSPYESW